MKLTFSGIVGVALMGCATMAECRDMGNAGAADDLAALILKLIALATVVGAVLLVLAVVVWVVALIGAAMTPRELKREDAKATDEALRRAFPRAHSWSDLVRKSR